MMQRQSIATLVITIDSERRRGDVIFDAQPLSQSSRQSGLTGADIADQLDYLASFKLGT